MEKTSLSYAKTFLQPQMLPAELTERAATVTSADHQRTDPNRVPTFLRSLKAQCGCQSSKCRTCSSMSPSDLI